MYLKPLYNRIRREIPTPTQKHGVGWFFLPEAKSKEPVGPFPTGEGAEAARLDLIASRMVEAAPYGMDSVYISRGDLPRGIQDAIERAMRALPRTTPGDLPDIEDDPENPLPPPRETPYVPPFPRSGREPVADLPEIDDDGEPEPEPREALPPTPPRPAWEASGDLPDIDEDD